MASCAGARIVVAGAGAVGSVVALTLARAGAQVTLADPAPAGANASGVAAGMLAPAMEAALDPLSHGHFDLFRRARDAWPGLADGLGVELRRCGGLWFAADEAEYEAVSARLDAAGARSTRLGPAQAEALAPGLRAPGSALHTPEDWRLDPAATLAALHRAFEAEGGCTLAVAVGGFGEGSVTLAGGETLAADLLVLATGGGPRGFTAGLPELAALSPIKGQILRLPGAGPMDGPVVRRGTAYVVPGAGGPLVGATMEEGAHDTQIDPAVVERLRRAAVELFPDLEGAPATAAAGVRYATPDGLPLVGAASTPGVFLALGARRNGWLLAPLIAEALLTRIGGGGEAPPFRPDRFLS